MATLHSPPAGSGHETRDVRLRPVIGVGIAIALLIVLTMGAMRALLGHYVYREAEDSPPASPLAEQYAIKVPPEPRLQTDPLSDLRRLRSEEQALLESYGWVDRQAGTVRIPIERAMELLAAKQGAATTDAEAPR